MRFLKFLTRALMVALSYEIIFKLAHTIDPSLFEESAIAVMTRPLGVLVGVIMILFLVAFYRAEKSNKRLALVLQLLIGFTLLAFVLRLSTAQDWFNFQTVRLSSDIVGIVRSVLLIIVLILYRRKLAGSDSALSYATVFLAALIGVGVIVNLIAFVAFASYLNSGDVAEPTPVVMALLFQLFLLTRLAAIYFLYRYEKYEVN